LPSSLDSRVAFTDVEVWAEAETRTDKFHLELISVIMEFQENGIPTADLKLAIGECPRTGKNKPAGAHVYASQLMRRDKVKVYARLKGNQAVGVPWGMKDKVMIFDGYVSRPAYDMAVGAAGVSIGLTHWLSDLSCTDKLTYLLCPTTAAAYTYGAVTSSQTGGVAMIDHCMHLYRENGYQDVWLAIKETFRQLASEERMDVAFAKALGVDNSQIKNTVMLRALDRMDKGKVAKLSIDAESLEAVAMVNRGIVQHTVDRASGNSAWETLVNGLVPAFMFSIIPLVNTATAAPVVMSSQSIYKTVAASEYWRIGIGAEVRALPVRSVRFYNACTPMTEGKAQSANGPEVRLNYPMGQADLAALDVENLDVLEGQVLVLQAPTWINSYAHALNTKYTLPAFGPQPAAGAPDKPAPTPKIPNPQQFYQDQTKDPENGLGNRLAQVALSNECLKNRMGSIVGRLRFDIAPGSSIAVGIVGKNVPFYGQGGNNMYAHVFGVSIEINAGDRSASTTLHLSHMRTEREQKTLLPVVQKVHPLYNTTWDGTSLLDGS
jgi:hypothetical protein